MANLTTLAAVKAYLGIGTATQDAVISALIPVESGQIQNWCARKFPSEQFTNYRLNGSGSARLMLPNFPILSVSSLFVANVAVLPSPNGYDQDGYIYDDESIQLINQIFPRGKQNVWASWLAGYQSSEAGYVPTGNVPVLTPTTDGVAATDKGVAYTGNGVALTVVGAGPTVGQYSFAAGTYTFNSVDYNHLVTMSYYYVPSALQQACNEMVGLDLKQRDNLGVQSKSLGGETVSYTTKGMTDSVKEMCWPFRRVTPT